MLTVVGQGANNDIFVIAYAILDVADIENWKVSYIAS